LDSSRIAIHTATQELIDGLKDRIRHADGLECWAMAKHLPATSIQRGFDCVGRCWVATWDDVPTVVFGVTESAPGVGCPWMLATDDITEMRLSFVRASLKVIKDMLGEYPLLRNYVDTRNSISIRWLRWLGFELEEPQNYGLYKLPFHRFEMRRQNNV